MMTIQAYSKSSGPGFPVLLFLFPLALLFLACLLPAVALLSPGTDKPDHGASVYGKYIIDEPGIRLNDVGSVTLPEKQSGTLFNLRETDAQPE